MRGVAQGGRSVVGEEEDDESDEDDDEDDMFECGL